MGYKYRGHLQGLGSKWTVDSVNLSSYVSNGLYRYELSIEKDKDSDNDVVKVRRYKVDITNSFYSEKDIIKEVIPHRPICPSCKSPYANRQSIRDLIHLYLCNNCGRKYEYEVSIIKADKIL